MTISLWFLAVIVIVSLLAGFWIGRSVKWMMVETESRITDSEEEENDENMNRHIRNGAKRIPLGWAIGSPVAGEVRSFCEGTGKGALIRPEQGLLYAPTSGKIIRLYPMGNEMLFRTDFGIELLLKVGEARDEMFSVYYRSRVVQNEIVGKGKLLLEFDMEGLQKEGVDTVVSVMVETSGEYREITLTPKEQIKTGEELLWVRETTVTDNVFQPLTK